MSAYIVSESGNQRRISTDTVRNLLSLPDVSVDLIRTCPIESRWFLTVNGYTHTVTAFPYDEDHRLLLKASKREEK